MSLWTVFVVAFLIGLAFVLGQEWEKWRRRRAARRALPARAEPGSPMYQMEEAIRKAGLNLYDAFMKAPKARSKQAVKP